MPGPEKKPETTPSPDQPEQPGRPLPEEAPFQNPHPTHVDLPHEEPSDDPRRTVARGIQIEERSPSEAE